MTKLAQTLGLTELQSEIIATVRQFVEKEVVPNAPELERTDTYPQAIVDQMSQQAGTFDMPEKLDAKALPQVRPFDQSRDIGDHESPEIVELHHAELRLERGEGIIGNLGMRSR